MTYQNLIGLTGAATFPLGISVRMSSGEAGRAVPSTLPKPRLP
jgi:hypothetical protein